MIPAILFAASEVYVGSGIEFRKDGISYFIKFDGERITGETDEDSPRDFIIEGDTAIYQPRNDTLDDLSTVTVTSDGLGLISAADYAAMATLLNVGKAEQPETINN